jgi:hypothetical protein
LAPLFWFLSILFLQWAADLLKASVLEDAAKLKEALTASSTCLTGECATDAAKSFVAITASIAITVPKGVFAW